MCSRYPCAAQRPSASPVPAEHSNGAAGMGPLQLRLQGPVLRPGINASAHKQPSRAEHQFGFFLRLRCTGAMLALVALPKPPTVQSPQEVQLPQHGLQPPDAAACPMKPAALGLGLHAFAAADMCRATAAEGDSKVDCIGSNQCPDGTGNAGGAWCRVHNWRYRFQGSLQAAIAVTRLPLLSHAGGLQRCICRIVMPAGM